MDFEFWLVLKYFRARRGQLARFTTFAAIAGIACGVAGLIAAQALTEGFRRELREKILGNHTHVAVFRTDGAEIENWQELEIDLKKVENVAEIAPTVYQSALLTSDSNTVYCVLRVTNDATREKTQGDSSTAIEIELGTELAEKLQLNLGDEAEIVLPPPAGEVFPIKFRARASGVFRTGIYDYDATWIRLAPGDLARVSGQQNFAPTVLNVSLKDPDGVAETAGTIRASLPPEYKVLDWREANRPLFAALDLEKKVALAIFALIAGIAALNITTTLALLVQERRLDIAVLRTCGARARNLTTMFLLEGLFLGATGVLFGVVLGLMACFTANYFKIISLPPDVYAISSVRLTPSSIDVGLTVFAALLLSLAATVYPAWRAARIKPLENLRRA